MIKTAATHGEGEDEHLRAAFAFPCFVLLGLVAASIVMLAWQWIWPQPLYLAGFTIDRLSAALSLLVAVVGVVTFRFAVCYLDGESGQRRFLGWLGFTIGAAYVVMLSTHLILFFVAWSLTSFGLHELLTHYRDRHEALRPARKKFLISRLGDLALITAIALIWWNWNTLELHVFLERVKTYDVSNNSRWVGLLIVVAALTKSAQFPFHSWLPETMESPTPVSALMHAGIINAGGALLLRFAPLIVRVPEALLLLTVIGTITATLGVVSMWAQVKIKRTLAWSTVSQMGFMMVQCGLAAFPAALLHILGHGCYKAWCFLRCGELPTRTRVTYPMTPVVKGIWLSLGISASIPSMALATSVTGYSPWHAPGETALAVFLALTIGQLWLGVVGALGGRQLALTIIASVLTTIVVVFFSFSLYREAEFFLAPVTGELAIPLGIWAWVAALVPILAFTMLTVFQVVLPTFTDSSRGRAWYVHALHGFYFGALADRFVHALWSRVMIPGKKVFHG